tara:strand:+ start:2345 stop:3208 length:864 start_codon:yes stop_codon:yes gene_type:complete
MRVLITGAFGQLGTSLSSILNKDYEVIRTGKIVPKNNLGITLDIQNPVMVKEVIKATKPDLIINLAAITNVDYCEKYPELSKEVNIGGLMNLCDSFSGRIIHLSTDYVFDGNDGPYSENDATSPLSVYGKTKLASERILLDNNPKHLVLRGNVLYDNEQNADASFLSWVLKSLTSNTKIKVVNDQINNPTWTRSMADIIELCISKKLDGVFHWGDSDHISRYEFAKIIAEKFSLDLSLIEPITTSELNQLALRPLHSGLKTQKIEEVLNVIPPTLDDCLNKIYNEKE